MPDLLLLLSTPLITALIGWLTNKVAIVMLFRPRQPLRILWWTWHGVVPRRQKEVAKKAADLIEREILDKHLVRREIQRIDVHPFIEEFANKVVYEKLAKRMRRIILFRGSIADAALENIHRAVVDILTREAEPMRQRLAVEAERRLDFRRMVEERVAGFDLDKLEEVVTSVAKDEFRSIEIMGGVLGFVVGLLQLLILVATGAVGVE